MEEAKATILQYDEISMELACFEILKNDIPEVYEWKSFMGDSLVFLSLKNGVGFIQLVEGQLLGLKVCTVFEETPPFARMNDLKLARLIYDALEYEAFTTEAPVIIFGGGVDKDMKTALLIVKNSGWTLGTAAELNRANRCICMQMGNNIIFKVF